MKTLLLIALLLSVIGLFTATVYFFKMIKARNSLKEEELKVDVDFSNFKR